MKIGLTGSHSTGKTTILSSFQEYKQVSEVTRSLINEGLSNYNENATTQTQLIIFNELLKHILLDNNVIIDRTLIDVLAYTNLSENYIDSYVKCYMDDMIEDYMSKFDKIIFFPIIDEIQLEFDNVRSEDVEYRKKINDEILRLYDMYEIPYHYLKSKTVEDRIEEIKRYIAD